MMRSAEHTTNAITVNAITAESAYAGTRRRLEDRGGGVRKEVCVTYTAVKVARQSSSQSTHLNWSIMKSQKLQAPARLTKVKLTLNPPSPAVNYDEWKVVSYVRRPCKAFTIVSIPPSLLVQSHLLKFRPDAAAEWPLPQAPYIVLDDSLTPPDPHPRAVLILRLTRLEER